MDRICPGIETDKASIAAFCERWRIRDVDLIERGTVHNPSRNESIERDLRVVYAA